MMQRIVRGGYATACALSAALVLCACPSDKKEAAPPKPVAQDTTPLDLNAVKTDIPPAAPDTGRPRPVRMRAAAGGPPPAPPELTEVVQREQSASQFCYQEFGQKVDPSLAGGVAMLVTVSDDGVSDAHVQADTWSSGAGKAVNDCLNRKAATAWRTAAGTVKPGTYVVQLAFRPS
jgi:hypothetical protein